MDWNRKIKQLMDSATRALQQALRQPGGRVRPSPWDAGTAESAMASGVPPAACVASAGGARATEHPDSFSRVAFNPPAALQAQDYHYHLYVPPAASAGAARPLLVMLHGCKQNALDFAAGTGMNDAAARAGVLVLYPEQTHRADTHGCWNWFRPEHQRRGRGEPALLMAMVQDVMDRHAVDATRIYVAGLSAGGAMAAVLAREYPDVVAAAGVHSGLPAGAAHNVVAALSAMKHGAQPHALDTPLAAPGQRVVPFIVFHGDADAAVHLRNGEQVLAAALGGIPGGAAALDATVEQGASPARQAYTRTVYRRAPTAKATVVAEQWVLHGGGHAWSGGSAQGSFTDPAGVSATTAMLRFFLEHRRA